MAAVGYSSLPGPVRHGCGRSVRWVHSPTGRAVLIDAEPQADGDLVLVLEERGWTAERRRGYRALGLRAQGAELYRHHRCGL